MNVKEFAKHHSIDLQMLTEIDRLKVEGLPVKLNSRLKSSLGRAMFMTIGTGFEGAAETIEHAPLRIEINPKLLMDPDMLRNTFLHEIAHVLAGRNAGHGRRWTLIARKLGCDGKRVVSHEAAAALGIVRKYRVRRVTVRAKKVEDRILDELFRGKRRR